MAEQAALHSRDTSAAVLAEALRQLTKYVTEKGDQANRRLLVVKQKAVQEAKDDLMANHYVYGQKAGKPLDSNEMTEWLNPKMDNANDAIDEVTLILEKLETTEENTQSAQTKAAEEAAKKEKNASDLKVIQLQSKSDEETLNECITTLTEIVENEERNSVEDAEEVESLLKEVETALDDQIKSWNLLKSLLDEDAELENVVKKEAEMKKKVSLSRVKAQTFITKIKPKPPPQSVNTPGLNTDALSNSDKMKVERMKLPNFSGDCRAYARFKQNFEDIVVPFYQNEKQRIFTLKDTCLRGEAKKLVENITVMSEIWDRLDAKYGYTTDIVNIVINDIENFQFPKQDIETGFIKLVDTLERGLQDLAAVKAREEIANAYTVKLLEGKLPKRIAGKWFDEESKRELEREEDSSATTETTEHREQKRNKFEELFIFLKLERKKTERMIQLRDKKGPKGGDNQKITHNSNGAIRSPSSFNNRCLIHVNASHLTRKCKAFLQMSVAERGKTVKDSNACKLCLSISHLGQPCPFEQQWQCNVAGCTEKHNNLVHGFSFHIYRYNRRNSTLLLIQDIETRNGKVKTFWDNGSSLALVSRRYARRMCLVGVSVTYELTTVGNVTTTHHTILYEVVIIDREGSEHIIMAFEIEEICGKIGEAKVDHLIDAFPSVSLDDVRREGGEIDLLIGMEYGVLHPQRIDSHEGLLLYESQFGTGRILAGTHQQINSEVTSFSAMVSCFAKGQINNLRAVRACEGWNLGVDFFTAEGFGVSIPPRCDNCMACKECQFETQQLSRREQEDKAIIKRNLVLDPKEGKWTTPYPFIVDPREALEDNYAQALTFLERTENRLARDKTAAVSYQEQVEDFINRGVITEISKQEQEEHDGPVFYLTHHEVLKNSSSSTPCRLVVNSSLKYKGTSFNDILRKGPSCLRDLFGIQLRFRKHKIALVCDLKKMYHSIHTTNVEKHVRRILWRDMNKKVPPKIYGFERVTFGDRPAAAIAAIAISETAKLYSHIDPVAAKKIEEDIYVDDLATGAETKAEIEALKKSIITILGKANFKVKGCVASGDSDAAILKLLGTGELGRILGLNWNPKTDKLTVITNINISKKRKGCYTEPNLKYEEIPRILEIKLTRRIVLRIVMSCYDPLGLLCVILVQLKIELRKLYDKNMNIGWDDALSPEICQRWIELLQLLKSAESVEFRRCIKPETAVGDPDLIIFNDGSADAMCVIAYLRWKLASGEHQTILWTAKTRVTPLRKSNTPRNEMTSAVMGTRLGKSISINAEMFFNRVIHILDSTCTLALLHKETSALGEFMGNKVSEALETTEPSQFYHTPSKENIADLGTRCNASIEDISENSAYQNGPAWLNLPMEEWPVTQDFSGAKIPEEELLKVAGHVNAATVPSVIDVEQFREDTYDYLIRVVARMKKIFTSKKFEIETLTVDDLNKAEEYCLKLSMKYTLEDMKKGKLESLRPIVDQDGIVVLASRANEGLKLHYNNDRFPILTARDPLAYLWMKLVHQEDHSGVTRTVAKSRRKYWVVKARRIAQKIRSSCFICRLIDKLLAMQLMAPLPKIRLAMAPVFYVTSLDLIGPILIKDSVKQKTTKKVWIVIYDCITTRALHLDLTENYGTDSILQSIRRFTAIRGCPSEFRSDQGSQLLSAAKDVKELVADWKWEVVTSWCTDQRIKWTVVPAEGQHQNGLSESLVKSVKHSLQHKIGESVLTFGELLTVLLEVANIINSRPIGIVSGSDPEQPTPLTPNDLLLGRSTGQVPQGPFDNKCRSVNRRFRYIQNIVTEWWETWYATVLPSLVPSYKWKQRHRNVQIGDVCLIKYKKEIRATYRLGRVTEVQKGEDDLVRKVTLKYKLPNETKFRTVTRPIHGIAVIVPVEEQGEDTEESLNEYMNHVSALASHNTTHCNAGSDAGFGVEAPARSGSGLPIFSDSYIEIYRAYFNILDSSNTCYSELNPRANEFLPRNSTQQI